MKHIALILIATLACGAAFAQEKKPDAQPQPQPQPEVRVQVQGGVKVQMRAVMQADGGNGNVQVHVVEMQVDGAKPEGAEAAVDEKADAKTPVDVPAIDVKLTGMTVLKPTPEQERQGAGLRWWGMHSPGTTLLFDARAAKGAIIAMKIEQSKLKALTDDLGNNLLVARKTEKGKVNLLNRLRGQPDRAEAVTDWLRQWQMSREEGLYRFIVGGLGTPGEGAMAIMLEADVVLVWAGDQKKKKVENVLLKGGTKVDFGFTTMEVIDLPEGWGNRENSIGLKFEEKGTVVQERIRQMRFYGEGGKALPGQNVGSGTSGNNGQRTITRYYNLGEKLDKVTMEVEYYDRTALVTVPLNVTTGVGF